MVLNMKNTIFTGLNFKIILTEFLFKFYNYNIIYEKGHIRMF